MKAVTDRNEIMVEVLLIFPVDYQYKDGELFRSEVALKNILKSLI